MSSHSTEWKKLRSGTDIRGREEQLTDDFAERVGFAFAKMIAQKLGTSTDKLRLAVGRDPRNSGPRLLDAVVRGMKAADSDVLNCGLCTTPAMYRICFDETYRAHGAVMVTASHFAGDQNGFKFVAQDGSIQPADIEKLIESAASAPIPDPLVRDVDYLDNYKQTLADTVRALLEDDSVKPLLGLHLVIDAGNGAGGFFAELMSDLGADVEGSLSLQPDGSFPDHNPNSEDEKGLERLAAAVLENRADLGISFDADCDRVGFINEDGRRINGNRLIALISAILLNEKTGATIVTDSVTSSGLNRFITEWGGIHYRYKRGHRNVIAEAKRLNGEEIDCPLAIETSGHAAFRENGFIDDGMYLAIRIICETLNRKRDGLTLASLIEELKEPVETLEVRLPVPEDELHEMAKDTIEVILSHTLNDPEWQPAPDNREGMRILFNLDGDVNNAWFQLRLSVHDPVLVLNAESDVQGGISRMLRQLYDVLVDADVVDPKPIRDVLERM